MITIFYKIAYIIITFLFTAFLFIGCRQPINTIDNIYQYQTPIYNQVSLVAQSDTLAFELRENVYNEIKSFNTFRDKQTDYISFYDQRSESINIYYLLDQRLCRSLNLKKFFKYKRLHKTSVYVKNWDSIFIINDLNLKLFDSSGRQLKKINFPTAPFNNAAMFDSHKLPVIIGNKLFAISRNRLNELHINEMRTWKVMYAFDLEKQMVELQYPLPLIYQENLYGDRFLEYNFCYNKRGKFVFSFPADTLVYETDLSGYNHSYWGRSQYHNIPILPVSEKTLENGQGLKEYSTRDSYTSIFYDSFQGYYLRFVKHRISEEEFKAQKPRRQTVLIFDENFRIIGESDYSRDYDTESLFFTPGGQIYVRTNFRNEHYLQFVRLAYQTTNEKAEALTKH